MYLLTDMVCTLKTSNQNVKFVSTLKYVFDIKSWISPHLNEIHGHTTPHIFRFSFNHSTKKAEMQYRHWSHDSWNQGQGLLLLKVAMQCNS